MLESRGWWTLLAGGVGGAGGDVLWAALYAKALVLGDVGGMRCMMLCILDAVETGFNFEGSKISIVTGFLLQFIWLFQRANIIKTKAMLSKYRCNAKRCSATFSFEGGKPTLLYIPSNSCLDNQCRRMEILQPQFKINRHSP